MGRINLTRIYTRLGDEGMTHLGDMSRVPKSDPRIEAYGTVDELNAQIGVLLALGDDLPERFVPWLRQIQNDLFDLGADLCLPPGSREGKLAVTAGQTEWLEQRCDEINDSLPPLTSFLLPSGGKASVLLHVCRTVCRRAERRALLVESVNAEVLQYLNRLSDLFFILGRAANSEDEILWKPGDSRSPSADEES
jgi:cob(I)alamin adenosyltransferase